MPNKSFLYAKYLIALSDAVSRTTLQIPFYAAEIGGEVKQPFTVTGTFENGTAILPDTDFLTYTEKTGCAYAAGTSPSGAISGPTMNMSNGK